MESSSSPPFSLSSSSSSPSSSSFELLALNPLDGRYASITSRLRVCLSEFSLIAHRAFVMEEWLVCLSSHPLLSPKTSSFSSSSSRGKKQEPTKLGEKEEEEEETARTTFPFLAEEERRTMRSIGEFSLEDAMKVKKLERETNHDLKAVEYVLKDKLEAGNQKIAGLAAYAHFGCTSEDVNNCAYALMFKKAVQEHLLPSARQIVDILQQFSVQYADFALLSRTHGQPATPSTFGKEMANFVWRLKHALDKIGEVKFRGKFNGAVGSFNALCVADRSVPWQTVAEDFVQSLGLAYQPYSTQIEPHDWIAELCDAFARLNTILLDLSRDLWLYISRDLLKLRVVSGEVGSSTMPHKVNPIDFENAEGNLQLANALLHFFSLKLPVSRLQRDLSDSTVLRSVGVSFGYMLVAYESMKKGLDKIEANRPQMLKELNENWAVLAEPVQTLLRKIGVMNAYETLKGSTRGQVISEEKMKDIIRECCLHDLLPEDVRTLQNLTPATYTGLARQLALDVLDAYSREKQEEKEKEKEENKHREKREDNLQQEKDAKEKKAEEETKKRQ